MTEATRLIAEGRRAEASGRLQEACERYREAVRAAPSDAQAHLNLGIALEALGDAAGATGSYEKALALDPAEPYAGYNLGKLRYVQGALAPAERLLREALQHRADFPEARVVLGCVLRSQGRLEPAAAEFEAALRGRPQDFSALFHYAGVLRELGRPAQAQEPLERALALEPGNLDARAALADVLLARNDQEGAVRELEALLRLRPDWVEALHNYGTTLLTLGRDVQAETALRRVIELDPGFALAYRMLGNLLHRHGRVAEMLELCRAALERDPGRLELASFELFLLNFSDAISAEALYERHRSFGERLERAHAPAFAFARAPDPERRLRVGYVSGDFNSHPVALFLQPLLERLDRSRFEACCYSTSTRSDEFTRRLAARADLWRDAAALSEARLAEVIHADRIDILVDLAGHSGIARLGAFALQPAPVQAAWLGYLNTTGLTRIRYRITDAVSDPPGAERLHTETLLRLPHSQWCYRPFVPVEPAAAPPCLAKGHASFGSFVQTGKLSPATLGLWSAILRQLPDARLAVHGVSPGRAADELLRGLAAAGVASNRVTLAPFAPLREYYAAFGQVDIALDSTPYSGGTTTCDALWMGVPVITLPGSRPASRSAASILTSVGLTDWIAAEPEDYVRRAVAFSREKQQLQDLRTSLRSKMQASSLMDEVAFTRDMENLYRQIWRQYCTQG